MKEVVESLKPFCGSADLVQLASTAQPLVEAEERGTVTAPTSEIKAVPPRKTGWLWALAGAAIGIAATLVYATWTVSANSDQVASLASLPSVSSNMESVREIPLFQLHDDGISDLGWCRSTSQLIVGADDGSISVRDLPNQKLIRVLMTAANSKIKRIHVADHRKQFFTVNDKGEIRAFDLPSARLAWSRQDIEAMDISVDGDRLAVLVDELEATQLRADNGKTIGPINASEMENYWPQRFELSEALDELSIQDNDIVVAKRFASSSVWCVADGRLARWIDANNRDEQHFVYAEHADPITAMLTFGYEPLILTGDARGFLRLWQAPRQRYSDMLLECATRIDSMELTYELRPKVGADTKRNRWSESQFDISASELSPTQPTVQATIDRDGVRHKLLYKLIE